MVDMGAGLVKGASVGDTAQLLDETQIFATCKFRCCFEGLTELILEVTDLFLPSFRY